MFCTDVLCGAFAGLGTSILIGVIAILCGMIYVDPLWIELAKITLWDRGVLFSWIETDYQNHRQELYLHATIRDLSEFPPQHKKSKLFDILAKEKLEGSLAKGKVDAVHIDNLTQSDFFDYVASNEPLLILDGAAHWRAVKEWVSDEYLVFRAGSAVVQAEHVEKTTTNFAYFLPSAEKDTFSFAEFMYKANAPYDERDRNYYFAEEDIPGEFVKDIRTPIFSSFMKVDRVNVWMNGNYTSCSLPHTDGDENLMAVVRGQKEFYLVSPLRRKFVYANSNYSPLDFYKPNLKRYPLFEKADGIRVIVNPGDILYIPGFWWHHVCSTNRTIGVNFWFPTHSKMYDLVMNCIESNECS